MTHITLSDKGRYDLPLQHLPVIPIVHTGENNFNMIRLIPTHDPVVKTIYMTSDISPFGKALEEELKHYPVGFCEKPFSTREISEMISRLFRCG